MSEEKIIKIENSNVTIIITKDTYQVIDTPIEKKNNIQVYPSKKRVVPNCKLAKVINNLTDPQFDKMMDGNKRGVVEMKNHKKHGKIVTYYKLVNNDNPDDTDPLTEFDRAVLSVCISEWEVGNRHTTPAIILRGLTGKKGIGGNGKIYPDQRTAILHSINKMMGLIIEVDLSDTNQKLNYNDGKSQKIIEAILPCKHITTTINGQVIDDTIYFLDESPLMKVSRDRKQLLTFDVELLDVPNQQNTPMNITVKNYVMNRIQEIKLHKLQPIITFADVFQKCRIDNAHSEIKRRAREAMIEFMNHMKNKSEIIDFEVTKQRNSFYSIKFTYSPKVRKINISN